jgi:Fic family protein
MGPAKYARAYLYTENDDNDTTYFIDFNLRVIIQAIENLQKYLARKAKEIKQVESILGTSIFTKNLNYRQLAVLSYALRNPTGTYSIESHRKSHNISYPTARSDLLQLVDFELLVKRKFGNTFVFSPDENIQQRLRILRGKSG